MKLHALPKQKLKGKIRTERKMQIMQLVLLSLSNLESDAGYLSNYLSELNWINKHC
jgi:hypothetical protein